MVGGAAAELTLRIRDSSLMVWYGFGWHGEDLGHVDLDMHVAESGRSQASRKSWMREGWGALNAAGADCMLLIGLVERRYTSGFGWIRN